MAWTAIIADEILQERCVSSRGRRIPRGLKRKMSGYPLRRARAPLSGSPSPFASDHHLSEQYWAYAPLPAALVAHWLGYSLRRKNRPAFSDAKISSPTGC